MDEIEINDNVKILKENDSYKIEFKTMQYELINSLLKTRIITGGSTDDSYKFIYLKANKVITLKEYQNENKVKNGRLGILVSDAVKMLKSLVVQLNYLITKESCTILGYDPEEIIVINDEKFAFLGSELVAKIDEESNMAMISCPYSRSDFFVSPELLKIKELPSYVHFKTAYFSLALVIIYMLLGDREFYTEYLNDNHSENILTFLNNHPIKNSKFYWLLSRCLVEDAKERSIILI
jgi:serine/threonine protein kinase